MFLGARLCCSFLEKNSLLCVVGRRARRGEVVVVFGEGGEKLVLFFEGGDEFVVVFRVVRIRFRVVEEGVISLLLFFWEEGRGELRVVFGGGERHLMCFG